MTEAKPKKTLISKLSEAATKVKAVAKDGSNKYQGYSFQSEASIKAAVKDALAETGIIILPHFEVTQHWSDTTRKGTKNNFVEVMGTFTITDGNESVQGSMPGCGQDSGEKAVTKACTTAQKYFYKQLFNITDKEEDPDATNSQPDGGYQSKQQQNNRPQNNRQQNTQQQNNQAAQEKQTIKNMNILTNATVRKLAERLKVSVDSIEKEVSKQAQNNLDAKATPKQKAAQYLHEAEALTKQYLGDPNEREEPKK